MRKALILIYTLLIFAVDLGKIRWPYIQAGIHKLGCNRQQETEKEHHKSNSTKQKSETWMTASVLKQDPNTKDWSSAKAGTLIYYDKAYVSSVYTNVVHGVASLVEVIRLTNRFVESLRCLMSSKVFFEAPGVKGASRQFHERRAERTWPVPQ